MKQFLVSVLVQLYLYGALAKEDALKFLFVSNNNMYYISTDAVDAATASKQCADQGFQLLSIKDKHENQNLRRQLSKYEDVESIWTSGEKHSPGNSTASEFYWTIQSSETYLLMNYKDFAMQAKYEKQRAIRDRRETPNQKCSCAGGSCSPESDNCGIFPKCNITLNECDPPKLRECEVTPPNCTAFRGKCSSTCPPCTVESPKCEVIKAPCTVTSGNCTTEPPICTITTLNCTTTRPNCITIEKPCKPSKIKIPCPTSPPCRINTGDLCSTIQHPCTTTRKPCVTITSSCPPETNGVPEINCGQSTTTCPQPTTICPPPTTTCKPPIDCSPIICTSPALVCQEPQTHCPNPVTFCPPPNITCGNPIVSCPKPEVVCPEPEVRCTKPLVLCPGPNITCPGVITHCSKPASVCKTPEVFCPDPIIKCGDPPPCTSTTTPGPPLEQATCPPDYNECGSQGCTTPNPKMDTMSDADLMPLLADQPQPTDIDSESFLITECVGLNRKYGYKWDLKDCKTPRRFICETSSHHSQLMGKLNLGHLSFK